jgi:hypothetical protein
MVRRPEAQLAAGWCRVPRQVQRALQPTMEAHEQKVAIEIYLEYYDTALYVYEYTTIIAAVARTVKKEFACMAAW